MINVFTVFIATIALFFLLLGIKSLIRVKFCVICLSVSLTWVGLLVLSWIADFKDYLLLGLLMGQSVLGVYYLAERKLKEELLIFRLPFLLTLTLIAYLLSRPFSEVPEVVGAVGAVGGLWLVFGLGYAYRNKAGFNRFVKKIIECCKNW